MHIWINLLDNAIKFSPSKGTITMFLKQEQDSVKFILEDEGPGIEDDVKSRIFDKFYQVDVFALAFCVIFYWFMPKKKESEVTVHAE